MTRVVLKLGGRVATAAAPHALELYEAGNEVVVVPCYRTVPDHSQAEFAKAELAAGRVDWNGRGETWTVRSS